MEPDLSVLGQKGLETHIRGPRTELSATGVKGFCPLLSGPLTMPRYNCVPAPSPLC